MTQNQELFKNYESTIKGESFLKTIFYLDIRLVKDIFLGMIMYHIKNKNDYNKFYKIISSEEYKNRIIDNKDVLFGKEFLNMNHDEICDILNDEEKHLEIFKQS